MKSGFGKAGKPFFNLSLPQFSVIAILIIALSGLSILLFGEKTGVVILDSYLVFYGLSLLFVITVSFDRFTNIFFGEEKGEVRWLEEVDSHAYKIVLALSTVFFLVWSLVFIAKQYSFHIGIVDSGIYSNIVSNTSQGYWLFSTHYRNHALGEHFSPIILAFVPLYWIQPSILWLMLAQAASIAVCPVILYFICGEMIRDNRWARVTGVLIAILWVSCPPVLNALNTGFHPSTLAPPCILLAFLFLVRERLIPFWVTMIFLLLFKENLSLIWVSLGLYSLLVLKRKALGWTLMIFGGLWGILVTQWIIPWFRGYEWGHPQRIGPFEHIPLKLKYLFFYLLLPLGFLPLLNFRSFLMVLPPVLLNLSVKYQPQFSAIYQYDDIIAPLLFVAAIAGIEFLRRVKWIEKILPSRARLFVLWLLIPVIFSISYPASHLVMYFPDKTMRAIVRELDIVNHRWPTRKIHFQYALGSFLNLRPDWEILKGSWKTWKFNPGELIVLAPSLKNYSVTDFFKIEDYSGALENFEKEKGKRFARLEKEFHYLSVYQVK